MLVRVTVVPAGGATGLLLLSTNVTVNVAHAPAVVAMGPPRSRPAGGTAPWLLEPGPTEPLPELPVWKLVPPATEEETAALEEDAGPPVEEEPPAAEDVVPAEDVPVAWLVPLPEEVVVVEVAPPDAALLDLSTLLLPRDPVEDPVTLEVAMEVAGLPEDPPLTELPDVTPPDEPVAAVAGTHAPLSQVSWSGHCELLLHETRHSPSRMTCEDGHVVCVQRVPPNTTSNVHSSRRPMCMPAR